MNRSVCFVVIILVAFDATLVNQARATATYWQHNPATSGDWFDPANWNNGKPLSNVDGYINNGGTARISSWGATAYHLYLGSDVGESGTIELLNGGGLNLCCAWIYVGKKGTGTIIQTGGTMASRLYLGYDSGGYGEYHLSGTGNSMFDLTVGNNGTGLLVQDGGTVTMSNSLMLGFGTGSSGTYELNNGQLSPPGEIIGYLGNGIFTQNGGTNTVTGSLFLAGWNSAGSGIYNLVNGDLTAPNEYVGYGLSGLFTQTGGTNNADYLYIYPRGCYAFSSGALNIGSGWRVEGEFDFCNRALTWNLTDAIVYLAQAKVQHAQNVNLSMDSNSLLILAPGVIPENIFGGFTTSGITHTAGSTLYVDPGQGFCGRGQIDDFVDCRGTITAVTGGFLHLNGGLIVSGGGKAVLNSGTLIVNNTVSGLDYGQITATNEYVGYLGTGEFVQTDGNNIISGTLGIGYKSGTGGSSSVGTYTLEDGRLSTGSCHVGYYGTGNFIQTGGTHTVTGSILIGGAAGGSGTYSISGGSLVAPRIYVGSDIAAFRIDNAAASVTISEKLEFRSNSTFSAVPGSAIFMTGADLLNSRTDANSLAGIANVELIFEGGGASVDTFEAAGKDFGPTLTGYNKNFALGTLTLGDSSIGRIQLVNASDNQPAWTGSEVLYVNDLNIGPGSYLDLNGFNLYYRNASIDPTATIVLNGGQLLQAVSVPVTLTVAVEPNPAISTLTPAVGLHQYAQGTVVDINAATYVVCPNVYIFDHWVGDVNNPNSANTTVIVDADKIITAVFVDGRQCGDGCHSKDLFGDYNHDCVIDFTDFAHFAENWLVCTKPECD